MFYLACSYPDSLKTFAATQPCAFKKLEQTEFTAAGTDVHKCFSPHAATL